MHCIAECLCNTLDTYSTIKFTHSHKCTFMFVQYNVYIIASVVFVIFVREIVCTGCCASNSKGRFSEGGNTNRAESGIRRMQFDVFYVIYSVSY